MVEEYYNLKKALLEKEFGKMNPMQRQAVFQAQGPLLILAGAGSGKTTVLVNRTAYLVKYGNAYHSFHIPATLTENDLEFLQQCLDSTVQDEARKVRLLADSPARPWNVLAITFTNKAAGELKQRLEQIVPDKAKDIWASTFHSCCMRILRRYIDRLGYKSNFTIYDTDDQLRVIKSVMKEQNIDDKMFTPKALLGQISRAKDTLLTPALFQEKAGTDFRENIAAKVYTAYQQKLKIADAVDFDDIIMLTVRLFQENSDVLEYYQNQFRYIMVDEYQDTNHAQFVLVSLLADKYKNLCVVGDDDQSIYKFRGATIENILNFEQCYENAVTIRLEQNYRCTQTILEAANSVIKNNTERKGKTLWTKNDAGDKVAFVRLSTEEGEAKYIADSILEHVEAGEKFASHAVLYRMNAQSNTIEKALFKMGIPYKIIGGLRFYERKEIKDMLAYLSLVNNHADTVRLLRIINEPKRGIGTATLSKASEIASQLGVSLFEVLEKADEYAALSSKAAALLKFAQMINELSEKAEEESLEVLFDAVMEKTGYDLFLYGQGEEGRNRLENINELKSNMIKYQQENEGASLSGFLEEVALYTDLDSLDDDSNNVILMTMHAAKGLEFPYVYIAGMEEGIFPGRQSAMFPEEIEEERRLAYVAITRAKKQLYITNAATRMLFGATNRNQPSRFVDEIAPECVETDDIAAKETQANREAILQRAARQRPTGERFAASKMFGGSASAGGNEGDGKKPEGKSFFPGDKVLHKIFGKGEVLSVVPMGGDNLVEIAFENGQKKKIMANFAKIEKLD